MNTKDLQTEPYTLEVDELTWLCKALSNDPLRGDLQMAAIAHYDGSAVLVSTDTHRMHILRLSPSTPFETQLIDIKRILFEARYAKAKDIQIDLNARQVTVGNLDKKTGALNPSTLIHTPVFNTIDAKFPKFQRVIPNTNRPVSDIFAINSRYLIDATELSRKHSSPLRTAILQEAPERPLVFQPLVEHPRWKAVVMPMATGEWEEV